MKNITGEKDSGFPLPQTMSYRENGKIITLKPGEYKETKLTRWSNRLRVVTEDEIKGKKKKDEVKNDNQHNRK